MTWKIGVILLVILGALYRVVLNIVEHRSANNPTPENVSDVYDAETYLRWKQYSAERCRLALVSSVVSCVISLVLLLTEVYAAFASLFPEGVFWQLLAVVLLECGVGIVVEICQSYVSTMVIEQKYGFNRSTDKTFIFDRIRSAILEIVLSLALAWLMYIAHSLTGDYLFLLFAGAMFLFSLLVTFLYPLLSRIGNKFVPLEEGELKD
ncbi:MAG: hypothetical protein IJW09_08185, partial [Clostridia bacterium]|nr:hypothetical protein [Clostridia bacterium]